MVLCSRSERPSLLESRCATAALTCKRIEAGGGSIGHGITNVARSAATAQQAAIVASRAAGGKAGHAAVRPGTLVVTVGSGGRDDVLLSHRVTLT